MPCGGIWWFNPPITHKNNWCFHCGLSAAVEPLDHACEEWDAHLHRRCVIPHLMGDEGRIVLSHDHEVELRNATPNELVQIAALREEALDQKEN